MLTPAAAQKERLQVCRDNGDEQKERERMRSGPARHAQSADTLPGSVQADFNSSLVRLPAL